MNPAKRPRLRGYPKHLKFAAELFRRDFYAFDNPDAKARLRLLFEQLYKEDVDLLKLVAVYGVTASKIEAASGTHNREINRSIRYVLEQAALVYAGARPRDRTVKPDREFIASRRNY